MDKLTYPLALQASTKPHTYRATFIQAGQVKARDQSATNWIIPPDALARAVPAFNGRAVFIDHAQPGDMPSLRNLVGITAGAHFNPTTQTVEGIIRLYAREDTRWVIQLLDQIVADQAAGLETPDIGLSIVFFSTAEMRNGTRVTYQIHYVESIDLVFGPAANGRIKSALNTDQGEKHMATQEEYTPQAHTGSEEVGNTAATHPVVTSQPHELQPISVLLERVDALNQRIEALATATAGLLEHNVVTGLGKPPTPQPTPRRMTLTARDMWSGLDRLQAAYEYLMGLPRRGDFERLTGIRELYMLLTGDRQLTGRFNPDLAMLAYNPDGNNADTITMAELTRNVMNKALIQQFDLLQEYRWWERVSYIQDFNSLQQVSWVRIGGIGDLPTVAEKAEYTQLAWDDARTTADWVKKGGYLPLSLEMIDRDDVEAWRSVPRQLATAAVVTLSSVVAELFTANNGVGPEITTEGQTAYAFSSTWGNLLTTALDYSGWQTAIETMYKMNQLNVSGRRIATRPRFLLVPVELEAQAISVVTSDRRPGTNYNDRVPTKRMLPEENVITVPHWTDAESWAALADPNLCPFVGVGFRYGRVPELFTASDPNTHLLFTNDVLPIKVRWYFAVSVIDPRGAVKSNV
ncbi:MAG: phage major capsid protein [Anaerolineae bacterium]